ncbi:NAD(P)-binding protein [Cytobacillus sp. FJAT-54145]|uniref:precorrin-2 dehydrogenase n=1 Tax=Cytobacillus spartinae TaxID=3299023 RepID=A0ABW6K503_9BACI
MSSFYPIALDLKGKLIVIIGGGIVAERKVIGLLESADHMIVISPKVTETIERLAKQELIIWKMKTFSPGDLNDAFLIIAATNDKEINRSVKESAQPHQLLNMVDDPSGSDFIFQSIFRRGKLMISISTSGASPMLASKIKRDLETLYGEEYEEYIEFLHESRQFILKHVTDSTMKKQLLSSIVKDESFLGHPNRKEMFLKLYEEIRANENR